jgi:hypothetical protein
MRLLLALALLLALPASAGAQLADPQPPDVTTGPATEVERTTAALTGTVDANDSETTYHFEYGTTSAYGLQTVTQETDGDEPVDVEAALQNLSPDTTYHYRIVAFNGDGSAEGDDRTFRTEPNPRPPDVRKTGATQVGSDGALLRSRIDPNDGATTYFFEYGPTREYGLRTAERQAGEGDSLVHVTEPIGGLEPFRRYHFRIVAINEAGQATSRNRSFVTSRLPTGLTLELERSRTRWGEGAEVVGRVTGTGMGGVPVGLERQDFPFLTPFSSFNTPTPVRTDRRGYFRMFVPFLFSTTRLQAVTRTAVAVSSPVVTAHVAVSVGAGQRRMSRNRVRVRGTVTPATPEGRAILQRRKRGGGWAWVRSGRLKAASGDRSRYSFKVSRQSSARRYRVRVSPRDDGAHVSGNSRSIKVKKRKR